MKVVPEKEAIEEIFRTVDRAEQGVAPFVLVLGSGFSHGLVPTAKEVVLESLPLWMHCQRSKECFKNAKDKPRADKDEIAKAFWKGMADEIAKRGPSLTLDPATGLPSNYAEAYKAAFDPDLFAALALLCHRLGVEVAVRA